MKVATGTVVDGRIEIPAEFASEGTQVMVLAPAAGEPVRLSAAQEEELLEAMEQIRRGDYVDGQELLNELRSHRT